MTDLAQRLAGKFLVLDGPDGSGKSTQIRLLADHLGGRGADVLTVRDPGGTDVGEKIRHILLDNGNRAIVGPCEMMLFMASRAQLAAERIRPAMRAGKVVVCDRWVSATLAYQGVGGARAADILSVADVATGGLWPDLTIVLDLPAEEGLRRVGKTRGHDRMEVRGAEYHRRVRRAFLDLCAGEAYPTAAVKVDADRAQEEVFESVVAALEDAFGA